MTDIPQGKAVLPDTIRFPSYPSSNQGNIPNELPTTIEFRTAYEIERDRRAAKGLPMPIRDGTHGE